VLKLQSLKADYFLGQVDHFLSHLHKQAHLSANINGVWNLVLADHTINNTKSAWITARRFLQCLY
jgi:hypothetical protein